MMTATSRTILFWLFLAVAPAAVADAADSAPLDLGQYQGKVVVLDFWASWCGPCRRSFPWLNEMHARYARDGLVIIGVNLDADRGDAKEFLVDHPADFGIYFDPEAALAMEYEVEAMPSSFVIGRDGQVTASHRGFKVKQQSEYEAILVEALGERP